MGLVSKQNSYINDFRQPKIRLSLRNIVFWIYINDAIFSKNNVRFFHDYLLNVEIVTRNWTIDDDRCFAISLVASN